jgi:hypothetical protein
MGTAPVCFLDTETTGLDPARHEIWEVALILPDGAEHVWQLPVDLARADPIALNIGRFHERRLPPPGGGFVHLDGRTTVPLEVEEREGGCLQWTTRTFAEQFVRLTRGLHLCGAVVSFDERRLWDLLRKNGECPVWHYHVIDVEALAVGWLRALAKGISIGGDVSRYEKAVAGRKLAGNLPWKSDDLSRAIGVDPDQFDRHTALGDAKWAKAMYDAVMA